MSKIIFRGKCISSDDPKRLGRIRAIPQTEDEELIRLSSQEGGKDPVPWSKRDPFVYKPLLPFFNNVAPKESEYVHLIYSDNDNIQSLDKFYIGGVFSSPTFSNLEDYNSAVSDLEFGTRNKTAPNIYNPNGELFNKESEGVYINPEDVAIQGRGSSDIIVKENDILLRSGKNLNYSRGQVPGAYIGRGFLQISKFTTKTTYGSPKKYYNLESPHEDVKILVEYNITNPTTSLTPIEDRVFMGTINVYNVKPGPKVNSRNFLLDGTSIELESGEEKSLRTVIKIDNAISANLFSKVIAKTVEQIAKRKNLNEIKLIDPILDQVTIDGSVLYSSENVPIYYRPSVNQFNDYKSTFDINQKLNLKNIFSKITFKSEVESKGYGLIFDEDLNDKPKYNKQEEIELPKSTIQETNTTSILGSDNIYLLSHKSKKLDSSKIDLSDTLYGISEDIVSDEIEPKTSSVVRGEELIELLELIVEYLISHVHAYHGMSPVPVSNTGIEIGSILKEIKNAEEKILNKNIRIN